MSLPGSEMDYETYREITVAADKACRLDLDARAVPDAAKAGEPLHLKIEVTPHGYDLPEGTVLLISFSRHWRKHRGNAFRETHQEIDTDESRPPGGAFCLAKPYPPEGSDLQVAREVIPAGFHYVMHMVFTEGSLGDGETLTVYLSDPISSKIEVPKIAGPHTLHTLVKLPEDDEFRRLEQSPQVQATGNLVNRLRLRCPSTAPAESDCELRVVAVDGVSENPAIRYDADLTVWRRGECPLSASRLHHSTEDRMSTVQHSTGREKFTYFQAHDVENALASRSNPMGRKEDFGGYDVYLGDMHVHYMGSDPACMRRPFEYGRWYSTLDFCGCEYQHNSPNFRFDQERWNQYLDINEEYNEPGEFVTLCAVETYLVHAHRITYFRNEAEARRFTVAWERGPEYDLGNPGAGGPYPEPEALWNALEGFEAITIPHHTRYIWPTDWTREQPERERCVEIYSRWGTNEIGGPYSVQQALIKGHRLGFVANTDNQTSLPGNGPFDMNEGRGLTGVLTNDLSREGIYQALWERRCYGTSGEQMLIFFAMGEHLMGSDLDEWQGPREFTARVAGTAELESVELLRNNQVIERVEPGDLTFEGTFCDNDDLADVMVEPYFRTKKPFCFYYLRATQIDGHMAWASPIWIAR
ncbi:MAG: hypothetical protein ACLFWB_07250 [Armatimonadota bacterium]